MIIEPSSSLSLNVEGNGHTGATSEASKVLNAAGDGHTGAAAAR